MAGFRHLRDGIEDPKNTVLIVGFQAMHTLGRRLVEKRARVKIFGVERERIGQALEKLGHKVVFLSDPGFLDVYKGYGFEAYPVNLSEPMPPEEMAKFWVDFINGHIPNFRKSPYDQIDNYVKGCWEMIVETAIVSANCLKN